MNNEFDEQDNVHPTRYHRGIRPWSPGQSEILPLKY